MVGRGASATNIAQRRLAAQHIARPRFERAGELVSWMGAVQAQDYLASLWAIGLRLTGGTETVVERAIADGSIVRTWPMRGTLHLVPAADVHWMLELLAPRVVRGSAGRLRQLGLDARLLARTGKLVTRALEGGRCITRPALLALLDKAGIATRESRGLHMLFHHAQEGLICFGPREGKQPTLVLLDEWVPARRRLSREESLAELGRRYFTSHGPATLHDFGWWSGLTLTECRAAVALAGDALAREEIDGKAYWFGTEAVRPAHAGAPHVHLLPYFDEYTVAYRDRTAVIAPRHSGHFAIANGMLFPIVVVDGQVIGSWKRTLDKRGVRITLERFESIRREHVPALREAMHRYARFLGSTLVPAKG
jgi:hypothetical protein